MQSGIWRFVVAPSDAAEKNCNICAQLQSISCIKITKMFWKIYFLYAWIWMHLVRTKVFIPSRFWTTDTNFDTCCQRYIATCGKYFIQMRIYVLVLKLLRWTLKKSVSYLNEVVRTNYFSDF